MKRYSPALSTGPLRVIARATMTTDTEGEYLRVADVDERMRELVADFDERARQKGDEADAGGIPNRIEAARAAQGAYETAADLLREQTP